MAEHTSIRSFTLALDRYARHEVPMIQKGRVAVIALEAAKQITMMTPVDTGRAKGNWQFTVGTPADGEVERLDPSNEGTPGRVTQAEVLTRVRDWQIGQWLWLHNGLPYISVLNDGDENRTAHHMLERTVAHLKAWLCSQ